tara:strand:+ start:212 stop:514 length:303 start_codon:yes stop_codon:yes gene_type:complete
MAVTAADVATWGRFGIPTGTELTLLDRVILAATSRLGRDYYLDDPTTPDQDMAIILVSVRLWARRNSPEGRDAFGGDFAVSISPDDADAVALLMPRNGLA